MGIAAFRERPQAIHTNLRLNASTLTRYQNLKEVVLAVCASRPVGAHRCGLHWGPQWKRKGRKRKKQIKEATRQGTAETQLLV
eukprot:808113-Amphidinium_carterae.1